MSARRCASRLATRMRIVWMGTAGLAKLLLSRDEEAVVRLRRAVETNRNWPSAHFYLAAALA